MEDARNLYFASGVMAIIKRTRGLNHIKFCTEIDYENVHKLCISNLC